MMASQFIVNGALKAEFQVFNSTYSLENIHLIYIYAFFQNLFLEELNIQNNNNRWHCYYLLQMQNKHLFLLH